ncbi:MAG: Bro-N domain-containing protein [Desulfomicrobium sp.]
MTALASADLTANAPVPFAFDSHQIRTVVGDDGQPWFVARDVCGALTIAWSGRKTLATIPEAWKRVGKLPTRTRDGRRQLNDVATVNEPAVYKLAFRSNKPEADRFTNWVASEVIPALRRTGKYEVCPAPEASRLTTAKERNALTGLVNRYVGLLPGGPNQEAFKAAWRRVHDVMGIKAIEELTMEQLPRAVVFVQSLIDATALRGPQKALPMRQEPTTIRDYAAFYRNLPDSPRYWSELSMRAYDEFETFGKRLAAFKKEALRPFREDRKSDATTYFDEAMDAHCALFEVADKELHMAYTCVYEALESLRNVWLLLRKG